MDLLLTSFGLGMTERQERSAFHRLPPFVLHQNLNRFGFDFAALLMFDRILVDEATYRQALEPHEFEDRYMNNHFAEVLGKASQEYSECLRCLEKSGRLLVKDFGPAADKSKALHEAALDYDMKDPGEWVKPLEESLEKWQRTVQQLRQGLNSVRKSDAHDWAGIEADNLSCAAHDYVSKGSLVHYCIDALKNWKKQQDQELSDLARDLLRNYLGYVNQNIILAYEFGASFMDWDDFEPFYQKKFRVAGLGEHPGRSEVEQSRKVFDLFLPYSVPLDMKALPKAIEDKRLDELRRRVADAVEGKVVFDSEFAAETLRQVLKVEQKSAFRRKITGWATLPLDLVPVLGTGFPKLIEEAANAVWSEQPRRNYAWYYFMNELIADPPSAEPK
jgi:hypothetical protein